MKGLFRYLSLYWDFACLHFKVRMEYRVDFLTDMGSFVIRRGADIVQLGVFLLQVPHLAGWSFPQILFIFGFVMLVKGLTYMFFSNLEQVGYYVLSGDLNRLLVRPLDGLFHLCAERFDYDELGEILVGVVILLYANKRLGLAWTPGKATLMFMFVICGVLVRMAIMLIMASVSFWIVDSRPLVAMTYPFSSFARYPLEIYALPIRFLLTVVLPFAIAGYFPAAYLLGHRYSLLIPVLDQALLVPLVAILMLGGAYRLWNRGLCRYESPGT
jgi:ABC-2 type transport system permease protein